MLLLKGYFMRRVYLDVATTGMELSDRIIEIALIEEVDEKLTGYRFNCLVNPQGHPMSESASSVTGHRDDQLKQFPVFSEIANSLMEFIDNAELVCWDVRYDLVFLNRELMLAGKAEIKLITNCIIGKDMRTALREIPSLGLFRRSQIKQKYSFWIDGYHLTWLQANCLIMAKFKLTELSQ
jgi:DNA polymerase-3 subunit epsilon